MSKTLSESPLTAVSGQLDQTLGDLIKREKSVMLHIFRTVLTSWFLTATQSRATFHTWMFYGSTTIVCASCRNPPGGRETTMTICSQQTHIDSTTSPQFTSADSLSIYLEVLHTVEGPFCIAINIAQLICLWARTKDLHAIFGTRLLVGHARTPPEHKYIHTYIYIDVYI